MPLLLHKTRAQARIDGLDHTIWNEDDYAIVDETKVGRIYQQRITVSSIGCGASRPTPRRHPKVKAWLKRHPRFHMHFTPTSASWLNQVERFFGRITAERIRRGVFKSVAELETAIQQYLDHHNADPKPFVWTASATTILEKVARGRQVLESVH